MEVTLKISKGLNTPDALLRKIRVLEYNIKDELSSIFKKPPLLPEFVSLCGLERLSRMALLDSFFVLSLMY